MGKTPFGSDKVMQAILDLCPNGTSRLEKPMQALSQKTGLKSEVTIKKYLEELENEGFVQLVRGDLGARIDYLTIKRREVPATRSKAKISQKPRKIDSQVLQNPTPALISVVALVDYDNTFSAAKEAGFQLSFRKLKDFLRSFGRIIFADVFLPFNSAKPEKIQILWEAGFGVILCPMKAKDKDAVDDKIKWRARQYLSETSVRNIVIVSRDSDFLDLKDFALDLGKELCFFDVALEKDRLTGFDSASDLEYTPEVQYYMDLIAQMKCGLSGALPRDGEQMEFLRDLIRAIQQVLDSSNGRQFSFKLLSNEVWGKLANRWRRIIPLNVAIKNVMTALRNKEILLTNIGICTTYYTLKTDDSLVSDSLRAVS